MKNKRAAMELTMGTMVTIVLLVAALILGGVLVRNIFRSAQGAVDLTDQQLREEINKLFSGDNKLVIYPGTKQIDIKQESTDGVGIGIKNLLTGVTGAQTFSYEVIATDVSKCGVTEEQVMGWTIGATGSNIPIPVGELYTDKVLFEIPTGSPLCTAKFRVDVYAGETPYASDIFYVTIKAK